MSNKYTESMNKITVDDRLKKRILEKAAQVRKEENNNIRLNDSKSKRMWTKSIGMAAACCAFVTCTSLYAKFPELFKNENINSNTASIEENIPEINSDNEETITQDNAVTSDNDSIQKNEDAYINNIGKENKQDNSTSQVNSSVQLSDIKKNMSTQTHEKIQDENEKNIGQTKTDISIDGDMNIFNEDSDAQSSNKGEEAIVGTSQAEAYGFENKDETVLSESRSRSMPGSIQNDYKVPEALGRDNGYEITYILLDSDNAVEVGYKDKEHGNGTLVISSKENNDENRKYISSEIVRTLNGDVVIKVSGDGKEKYTCWKAEDRFYSLYTDVSTDNEEIVSIIESCR